MPILNVQANSTTIMAIYFVKHILHFGATNVVLWIANTIVFPIPRLVKNTNGTMRSTAPYIAEGTWLEYEESFSALENIMPGSKVYELLTNHMTILW